MNATLPLRSVEQMGLDLLGDIFTLPAAGAIVKDALDHK
jgi:hypothetical protein